MNKPLLYALQIREEDLPNARQVARLHSLIRPNNFYEFADCMVVYRKDCPRDEELENSLSKSFETVSIYRVKRKASGHPSGPNAMWCDLMQEIFSLKKLRKLKAECVLTTEADAIPIAMNWDSILLDAWRHENVRVAGHHLDSGDHDCGHINGNALFSPYLTSLSSKLTGCADHKSWDTWFAPIFESLGWADIPEIRSWHRRKKVSETELRKAVEDGCVWLHGVKDNSAISVVENWVESSQQFLMFGPPRLS